MNPDRDDMARDETLLRRWDAATARAGRPPLVESVERGRSATRRRAPLVGAAAALLVVAIATAGVAAWISFRNGPIAGVSASPSSTPPATSALPSSTESPIASEIPTATPVPSAQSAALRQYESIAEIHRIGAGGWVLTNQRLLLSDGTGWRTCLDRPLPGPNSVAPWMPNTTAVVSGDSIRTVVGDSMALSTDGCDTWSHFSLPISPTGMSFPTAEIGYIVSSVGPDNLVARIYGTADGGAHWVAIATVKSATRYSLGTMKVAFADTDHGWLTDGQTLWSTSNGARSWNVTHLAVPASVRGSSDTIQTPVVGPVGEATVVAKYDRSTGMDGVPGQLVFYRSSDAGSHWSAEAVVADPGMLMTAVVDSTTWVVADPEAGASVQATTDGGRTWQTTAVTQHWTFRASSISFVDATHGWLIVNEPEPPCPQESRGYMICDYAFAPPQHLVATDDGGATWHTILP